MKIKKNEKEAKNENEIKPDAEQTEADTETEAKPENGASAESGGGLDEEPDQIVEIPAETDEKKYNDLLDRYQRTLAEFDNFRKRTLKEKAVIYDEGLRDTVEKLLPVIDNFERALHTGEDRESKLYQGVEMIARQLESVLTELGIERIPAAGESFNPNQHFAVAHTEDAEYGAGVILDELQKGYRHKDKIIRPSMVRVAN